MRVQAAVVISARTVMSTPRHKRSARHAACADGLSVRFLLLAGACFFLGLAGFAHHAEAAPGHSAASARNDKPAAQSQIALGPQFKGKLPITELTEDQAILHALNRLGYGPRPGDLERVKQMGLEKWIEQQLHPESIDDSKLQERLQTLPAVGMNPQALLTDYPQPDAAAKKLGITVDEYRKRMNDAAHPLQGQRPAPNRLPQEVLNEMEEAKVLRAIYSERQLDEQLTDFWFNHFNVFAYKDLDLWLLAPYERDAVRPHVLGKFRVLLESTAKSPAMLFYLDNYLSADPAAFDRLKHPSPKLRPRPGEKLPPVGPKRGLNENYGREIMELHTLGVDGGYTQQDVIEAAKALTGWTIKDPRVNSQFYFDERLHDPEPKRILGKKIHADGMKDGEQVLDLLVKNPHTAHHIALELAQHFVSDNPPDALVNRMAKSFQKSGGDIRETMRTMIYSPEFWSKETYRAKVKRPFELVVSTARALDADVDDAMPLVQWIARIGEPLYQCVPPTGYSDKAEAWVNSGALLNRLNYAIALAGNHIRGSEIQLPPLLGNDAASDPYQALDRAVVTFLAGQVSDATRATLEKESSDPRAMSVQLAGNAKQANLAVITGLVLGSPEFQQR